METSNAGAEQRARAKDLAQRARRAWSRSGEIHQQVTDTAEMIAATEEAVAATLDRLALDRPQRAEHLTGLSASARDNAARERQWAEDHRLA